MKRICHQDFDAQEIAARYPAQLNDRNKQIVFDASSPPGANHSGTISFSRWRQMRLPDTVVRHRIHHSFELRRDFFTYGSSPQGWVVWHLNFAHHDLFRFYGGPLLAQDEMQVAEHPALASLRHAILDAGLDPLTVEHGEPTPALIMGVERRCRIATDENPSEGRRGGIYGNNFSRADEDTIIRATEVIDPAMISNILAMEAPGYGSGRYTKEQIELVLSTAFTGFSAAIFESKDRVSPNIETSIHTGFWGCGAYGGNRQLMAFLQMVAACETEVNTLVFHSGPDSSGYDKALALLEELLPVGQEMSLYELLSQIEAMGFEWGVSDGT